MKKAITPHATMIMPDFLLNAVIAGTLIAILAGPLGCFVVWRRMAYFGAALAHSALLGVALSLFIGSFILSLHLQSDSIVHRMGQSLVDDPWPMVLVVSLLLAVGLLFLQRRHMLSNDTLLGIVAHGSLAIGLLVVAAMASLRTDVMAYLFGDILSIHVSDIVVVSLLTITILGLLGYLWRDLLSITINSELAVVEGINVHLIELLFVLMLATVMALGMRVVGVLLIISMLIIPPATVRRFVSTPLQMVVASSVVGVLDVWLGLAFSWFADLPAGPSIVAVSTIFFVLSLLLPVKHVNT